MSAHPNSQCSASTTSPTARPISAHRASASMRFMLRPGVGVSCVELCRVPFCRPQNSTDNFRRRPTKLSDASSARPAKVAWPFKTAVHIAAIAKITERHAERIVAGEFEPPAAVLAAFIVELTRID